jgi:exodeoxyribonuclease VII large subunit
MPSRSPATAGRRSGDISYCSQKIMRDSSTSLGMTGTGDFFQQSSKVLTVSELTRSIRGTLETRFRAVWVHGEISNYKLHPSGHQYFTLKDQRAQISCVIFRNTMAPIRSEGGAPLRLADGAQVQIYGSVSVFEARGQYQLNVQILQPRGLGVLQAKFETLKRKLEAEGLFAAERKRPLPKFPKRIGIVTSPSGAAIRDILNILKRRAPWLQILINPVRVQGTGAAGEIAVAIRELASPNESFPPVDLIVIARGGGSMEDLWEFNEEIVARTIADIDLPVVSAIGHEIDFTICDFVSDLRAPTPSAAAELIVPDIIDLRRRVDSLADALGKCLRAFVEHQKTRLRFLSERALARELINRLRDAQQQIDLARESLHRSIRQKIENCGQLLKRFEGILRVLGPDATLRRGYSITMDGDGKLIRSVAVVRPGMKIRTRVSDGEFGSETL